MPIGSELNDVKQSIGIAETGRLFDFCHRNARSWPTSVCFVSRNDLTSIRLWSWSDLMREVFIVSDLLRKSGVFPQSRVVNQSTNSLEWILIELACSHLNAIHVPLDSRLPKEQTIGITESLAPVLVIADCDDQLDCMSNSNSRFLVNHIRELIDATQKSSVEEIDGESIHYSPSDIANILYTSGTTSSPKGVMLTHRNLVSNAMAKLDAMPQFRADRRLNLLPFSHAYAKTCEIGTWLISGSCLELATSGNLLESLSLSQSTLFNGVPIVYQRIYATWMKRGGTPETLRQLLGTKMRQLASGGAAIRDDLRVAFEQAGFPIFQGYGLTEAGPVVCSNRSGAINGPSDRRLEGVGPPVHGVELRIDKDRKLWVRGSGVMAAYWNDPRGTEAKIIDGWLDTGDIASFDAAMNVRIHGRDDDVLVLENGYKIDPLGIEQSICETPGVVDCVLVPTGESGFDLLVLIEPNAKPYCQQDWEREIIKTLALKLLHVPRKISFTTQPWTEQNGLRNYKGAKNRKRIHRWYELNRDLL